MQSRDISAEVCGNQVLLCLREKERNGQIEERRKGEREEGRWEGRGRMGSTF